ncbi:hypothetical protein RF11_06498 [Thelohanellus kitauei]|uniref:Uncharacterized protein n=1 Tax=Thelohanellus kitauei TaxID=669202 RepID=A0A0C2NFQ6_THEKT|nr:hypothetical protein RF11_06498 [Thelohanellus kitauei]
MDNEIHDQDLEPEKENYFRPHRKNCDCLNKFFKNLKWMNINLRSCEEAHSILESLRSKALELSNERFTKMELEAMNNGDGKSKHKGKGKQLTNNYVQYIVETRQSLKDHKLCEEACKMILKYSNNVIHRKLKYDNGQRNNIIQNAKSNYKTGDKMKPLENLVDKRCCKFFCTKVLKDNIAFFQSVRATARASNQLKRMAAKMLIKNSPDNHPYCSNFIVDVIGCSHTTLRDIKYYMNQTTNSGGLIRKHEKINDITTIIPKSNQETNRPLQEENIRNTSDDVAHNCLENNQKSILQPNVNPNNMTVPKTNSVKIFPPADGSVSFRKNGYVYSDTRQNQPINTINPNISVQQYNNASYEWNNPNNEDTWTYVNADGNYAHQQYLVNNFDGVVNNNYLSQSRNNGMDIMNYNVRNRDYYQNYGNSSVNNMFQIPQPSQAPWNTIHPSMLK